jgi:SAM-dependent methyltransferase
MSETTSQVQRLYERRPYPHYPLLAKPRWQDGYLGSSLFAHRLCHGRGGDTQMPRNFLSIGSGEILPYIIRQWESSATRVDCVDLSQRSIRRAQFRTALLGRKLVFHCNDINVLLQSGSLKDRVFDHVEAYGVLHHISDFTTTLRLIGSHLTPQATVRIMVYNSPARSWIWQLNRAFQGLGLKFESDSDIEKARNLLFSLAQVSPRLDYRLKQLGETSLKNNTRFADTFLHPWESRSSISNWLKAFNDSGLRTCALFDRYAELDDLENPLWRFPDLKDLEDRAHDLRFENNLEIWLKPDPTKLDQKRSNAPDATPHTIPVRLRLTMPPTNFMKYTETDRLPFAWRLALWHGFLKSLHGFKDPSSTNIIKQLDFSAAARLARMGLILPDMAAAAGRFDELIRPMVTSISPPILPEASNDLIGPHLIKLCTGISTDSRKIDPAVRRIRTVV